MNQRKAYLIAQKGVGDENIQDLMKFGGVRFQEFFPGRRIEEKFFNRDLSTMIIKTARAVVKILTAAQMGFPTVFLFLTTENLSLKQFISEKWIEFNGILSKSAKLPARITSSEPETIPV